MKFIKFCSATLVYSQLQVQILYSMEVVIVYVLDKGISQMLDAGQMDIRSGGSSHVNLTWYVHVLVIDLYPGIN